MTNKEVAKYIKQRCKEIKLPKKRLRKDDLLIIGYVWGMADAVDIYSKPKVNQSKRQSQISFG